MMNVHDRPWYVAAEAMDAFQNDIMEPPRGQRHIREPWDHVLRVRLEHGGRRVGPSGNIRDEDAFLNS